MAVGAVNITFTLCSSITRQNVLASGVFIGLPSKTIVAFRLINGPYTIKLCPTTQPTSEAAQKLRFLLHHKYIA